MKKRKIKNGKETEVVVSEATDGVNRVRLIGNARAEEEECPWEEIDAYSGRFVVAGYRYAESGGPGDTGENYHPWLAYSTDGGKTWAKSETTSDEEQTHGRLYALAYGGGRFVVAGYRYAESGDTGENCHPWLAYSTDGGKTWTPSETTSEESRPHGVLRALAYGGGRFVVAGYRYAESGGTGDTGENHHPWLAYSTDGGKTWTPSETTSDEEQTHGRLYALAYGGGRFVVAGYSFGGDDNGNDYSPWLAYSTDGGKTWAKSETTGKENRPRGELCALAYGGGRFVVAGRSYGDESFHPWLACSADGGKTWTPSDTTSDGNQKHGVLFALAYGGGRFVVAGYRYAESGDTGENYHPWLAYSTDGGETWAKSETTGEESRPHGVLRALAYGGGRFVVAGYSHGDESYRPWLAYSADGGKTWTPSDTTSDEGQPHGDLYAFAYAPDSYCWKFGKEEEEEEEETET